VVDALKELGEHRPSRRQQLDDLHQLGQPKAVDERSDVLDDKTRSENGYPIVSSHASADPGGFSAQDYVGHHELNAGDAAEDDLCYQ
jgi:hypothetical protein